MKPPVRLEELRRQVREADRLSVIHEALPLLRSRCVVVRRFEVFGQQPAVALDDGALVPLARKPADRPAHRRLAEPARELHGLHASIVPGVRPGRRTQDELAQIGLVAADLEVDLIGQLAHNVSIRRRVRKHENDLGKSPNIGHCGFSLIRLTLYCILPFDNLPTEVSTQSSDLSTSFHSYT